MFDSIITISLNPAIDTTIWVEDFDFSEPNFSIKEQQDAGGKSINVSRVLSSLGTNNICLGFNTRNNKDKLEKLLHRDNVRYQFTYVDGEVRENFSIVSSDNKMLKVNRNGFKVTKQDVSLLYKAVCERIKGKKNSLIVFAGSLPKEYDKQEYKKLILDLKLQGAKIVLDNSFFSVNDIIEISPFIIKPNILEFSSIFSQKDISDNKILELASSLTESVEHIIVSRGSKGLLYCSNKESYLVCVPKVNVKSTVGAGDTTLAGFIYALNNDFLIKKAVVFAGACGTASVMLDGTGVIQKSDMEKILNIMPNVIKM